MEENSMVTSINNFQSVYDDYFKALTQYMMAEYVENHEYKFTHPTLFDLSIELIASFYSLPEDIRNRLLLLNFEAFLHCNNQIDFFSFRIFLSKKNRFQKLVTIAERVDAELKCATLFIEQGVFEEYGKQPLPNHDFYKEHYINTNLFKEIQIESQSTEETVHISDNQDKIMHSETNTISEGSPENKNIFSVYNESLKKGEEVITNTNNFVDKFKYSIILFKDIFKLFN
ncbi:hypothetical protein [Desmospora profundinema]|uniref:Uncharacterized protein n=1 Tax=Desmospora profundinema TaxID=1571184 RepID=A0ABU1IQY9_9BACL|nr:hypothetical protein [Desmospora profundinema]MDR6227195.1 hypothetical protein [Desmospora profundinema]